MDERYKVAISRLGLRVRVAGSAETRRLARTRCIPPRCRRSTRCCTTGSRAPSTLQAGVQQWKGARPMLPDGPPMIGASGMPGVWINLGHGSSGWALSCGSARVLADLMAGRDAGRRSRGPGRRAPAATLKPKRPSPCSASPSATAADLFDVAASRRIEQAAAAALPPHTLMQRAGLAVARLAMAMAPHARTIWIACGPGNNGGDGFEAAAHLQQRGFAPVVTRIGDESRLPADARASLQRARDAGVRFADAPPQHADLAIDALLGIGAARPPEDLMADWLRRMHAGPAPVLSVDMPSGLNADTGVLSMDFAAARGRHGALCLSLLTLKPGLFTAQGRDAAGEVWFDDLGVGRRRRAAAARLPGAPPARAATACLAQGQLRRRRRDRRRARHGRRRPAGRVGRAARGAGRVFVAPARRRARARSTPCSPN